MDKRRNRPCALPNTGGNGLIETRGELQGLQMAGDMMLAL